MRFEPSPLRHGLQLHPGSEGFPTASIKKELEELGNRMIQPELLKDVLVQVGSTFEVITKITRDYEVDLIVLTTHGKIGLKHVFGGALPNASCGTRLARSWSRGRTSRSSFRINRVAARAKVTAQSGENRSLRAQRRLRSASSCRVSLMALASTASARGNRSRRAVERRSTTIPTT